MKDIAIEASPYRLLHVLLIIPASVVAGVFLVALSMSAEILGGQFPPELIPMAKMFFGVGVIVVASIMTSVKNLYFDPLRKVFYYTRPFLIGRLSKRYPMGRAVGVEVNFLRRFGRERTYAVLVTCENSLDKKVFEFRSSGLIPANILATKIRDLAGLTIDKVKAIDGR